jgi:hypothetical protein
MAANVIGYNLEDRVAVKSPRTLDAMVAEQGPKRAPTRRDVKNEDRSGYVHENTGDVDKISSEKQAFYRKMD